MPRPTNHDTTNRETARRDTNTAILPIEILARRHSAHRHTTYCAIRPADAVLRQGYITIAQCYAKNHVNRWAVSRR
eukprot:scaffold109927_cov30-Tisochrysis_lutea.AAC.4